MTFFEFLSPSTKSKRKANYERNSDDSMSSNNVNNNSTCDELGDLNGSLKAVLSIVLQ